MTVDFSDFDQSIRNLNKSLDALKENPDEASKKIAAFLKENEKFLAAHKKNHHVQEQIDSLAGRVQATFPESKVANRWAEHLQSIVKSPLKILEPEEFKAQVKALKRSISAAKGKEMGPDLSKQLKDFVENPRIQEFLRAHRMNPTIGRELLELGIIAKKFRNDPQALRFAEDLIERAKEMQLASDIIPELIQYIFREEWENLPDEWDSLYLDVKIQWINDHQAPLSFLGFRTVSEALPFLKQHGHKLRYLILNGREGQFGNDITNESLREMLSYCPLLKTLELISVPINELPPLPMKLEVFSMTGTPLTRYPAFPEGLKALYLSSNDRISLEQFPRGLQCLYIRCSGELPPWPESLKALILFDSLNLEYPLPEELECLYLFDSQHITELPRLPESLKFLFLMNLYQMAQNFEVPRGLQFAKIGRPLRQPHLPDTCEVDPQRTSEELEKFLSQFYTGFHKTL